MRKLMAILTVMMLTGCGVETATTAATGAAIKKQELEQAQKTLDEMRKKIDQAMQQTQQRTEHDADK